VSVPTGGSGPVTVTAGSSAAVGGVRSAATHIVAGVGSSWVMLGFFVSSFVTGILMVWL
jgi:hypothetical protein